MPDVDVGALELDGLLEVLGGLEGGCPRCGRGGGLLEDDSLSLGPFTFIEARPLPTPATPAFVLSPRDRLRWGGAFVSREVDGPGRTKFMFCF